MKDSFKADSTYGNLWHALQNASVIMIEGTSYRVDRIAMVVNADGSTGPRLQVVGEDCQIHYTFTLDELIARDNAGDLVVYILTVAEY